MAATISTSLISGATKTWTSTGGDHVLNFAGVINGAGRAGDKSSTGDTLDSTRGLATLLQVIVTTQVQVAPTSGLTVDCYLGFSSSATAGTDNPGGLTGADAALSNVDILPQLVFVGSVVMSNSIGLGVQKQRFLVQAQDAYLIPVLVNNSGQTISATGTQTTVTITPWYQQNM